MLRPGVASFSVQRKLLLLPLPLLLLLLLLLRRQRLEILLTGTCAILRLCR